MRTERHSARLRHSMGKRPRVAFAIRLTASALIGFLATSTSAQVFYEAPRSQWGGADAYYYGGDDPLVHRFARGASDASGTFGRVNGYAWVSARRTVSGQRLRVFVDDLGFLNAADFGATPDTAHNDRMARMSTYFRKADLLEQAIERDGALHVPAHPVRALDIPRPGTIIIRPSRSPYRTHGEYPPVQLRGPVYRFPRELLDRPLPDRPLPETRESMQPKSTQAKIEIRTPDATDQTIKTNGLTTEVASRV